MTLTTTASRVDYQGSGSTGPFSVPFRFDDQDDLLVIKRDDEGTETELTITTHYTVSGAGNATGSVTLVAALASGETLSVIRRPSNTQTASFRNQGSYRGAAHEEALDSIAMLVQSIQEQLNRSIGLTESYDPASYTLRFKPGSSNQVLGWVGGVLQNMALPTVAVSTHPTVDDFEAAGDYDPITDTGTDDTAAFEDALTSSPVLELGRGKKYRVTGKLDFSNKIIIANDAEIWRTDDTEDYVAAATGTVGTYEALTANATKGTNILVCAALATALTANGMTGRGQLVKVKSAATFLPSGGDGLKQGEMAVVRHVSGSNVYLETDLNDGYTTANTAQAAIVAAATFGVVGTLTLARTPSALTTETYGLQLKYCMRPAGKIATRNCTEFGVVLSSCYAPTIDADGQNTYYSSSGLSYGVAVTNSTMYARITGRQTGVRHAIQHGGAPAEGGVAWGTLVHDMFAQGMGGAPVYDAHEECGSVFFWNCIAQFGTMDQGDGTTRNAPGWNLGARYNYVMDCTAVRCTTGVSQRGDTNTIQKFVVLNLTLQECTGTGVTAANVGATIVDYVVVGVYGDTLSGSGGTSVYGASAAGTAITKLHFANISIRGGGAVNLSSASLPAKIRLVNCECEDTEVPTATLDDDWRGFNIASAAVTHLHLIACRAKNKGVGMRITNALTELRMDLCDFEDNTAHIRPEDAVTNAFFLGGTYRGAKHTAGNIGVLNYSTAQTCSLLSLIGVTVDTDPHFNNQTTTKIVNLGNNFPAPASFDISRVLSAGWLEILAGDVNNPKMLRGDGSPDTVVTAPLAAIFQRADGASATLLYVNDDGATSWTAFA